MNDQISSIENIATATGQVNYLQVIDLSGKAPVLPEIQTTTQISAGNIQIDGTAMFQGNDNLFFRTAAEAQAYFRRQFSKVKRATKKGTAKMPTRFTRKGRPVY
jgi:hypothetical protein